MKKITLTVLITSAIILLGIFILSIFYPTVDISKIKVPLFQEQLVFEEVSKHNTEQDCFLMIESKVYDVSSYIVNHPGGKRSITSRCGTEVTGIFASIHSNFAWDLLSAYYIGPFVSVSVVNDSDSLDNLKLIESFLSQKYPNSEIVNIKPSGGFYIAKLIFQNALYEVHLNLSGQILREEIENDEFDWSNWDQDEDDMSL